MALDNQPRPPREEQWRAVFIERPEARPDLFGAIYLRQGRDGDLELYSGYPKTSAGNRPLFELWYLRTFARASVAAHRKTIAGQKAAAPVDPRW